MKRLISVVLAFAIMLCVLLVGCSKNDQYLSNAQWIIMINNAFGMESYNSEKPLVKGMKSDDKYFSQYQIAAEWGVIDTEREIHPENNLLWRDAIVTLVNAGGFLKENSSDDEKIDYAINNFDKGIRKYRLKREITVNEASGLLTIAHNKWANREYTKSVENVKIKDEAVDLKSLGCQIIDYDKSSGILALNGNYADKIKDGAAIVFSNDNSVPEATLKAERVTTENGITYIDTTDAVELGDVVDELYVENTFTPDLTKAEIYDGNGNIIQSNGGIAYQSYSLDDKPTLSTLVSDGNKELNVLPLVQKTTFTFETDDCKVEVAIKQDGLSAKIEVPFSDSVKGYYETEVSNFKVTNKIDYSWFTLHSAEIKVDYQTKNSIGIKNTFQKKEQVYAPKWSNGNGSFLTNLKKSVWKDKENGIGAKTIKLGSIQVASIGIASFSVDIIAKLKVDGSIEVSCSETGCKGVEYKNGNCRVINTSDKDTDVKFKCKAEGTVSVVPTVNAFGFAIIGFKGEIGLGAEASLTLHLADPENHLLAETNVSDVSPEVCEAVAPVGLEADAAEILKLAEEQGGTFTSETSSVKLHLDTCIDINVYFILKVGIEETTLAGKLLKGTKIKIEWEICGSKNAKICNIHVENFDFVKAFSHIAFFTDKDQCTMKYKPFDGAEEKSDDETTNEDSDVTVGEVLTISTMYVELVPDSTKIISVVQIPKGYSLKDISTKSENEKVATIDKNGVIKAVSEGSTTIIVSTNDGKYSCACSVSVVSHKSKSFTPLSSNAIKEFLNDDKVVAA